MELPQTQFDILTRLGEAAGAVAIHDLARALDLDQSPVTAACGELRRAGYAVIEESHFEEFKLGPEAEPYADKPLPERTIVRVLREQGGSCPITAIPRHCELSAAQVGATLRWLRERNWARKEGDCLALLPDAGRPEPQPDEMLLKALSGGHVATRDELQGKNVPVADALRLLGPRKGFLIVKERTARHVALTDAGRELLAAGVKGRRKITQLTPELLTDGAWRQVDIQPYDVTLAAQKLYPGKEHPFQRTLDRARRAFLEMGFEEVTSPWVESSFWDFDALFQPQDHPARDMQDTFYVGRPERCQLPDDALVARVGATHENGGTTGSTGWQYRWNRALAQRPVLRTHTTAATIRALARHTAGRPGKYFIIGPVFRRETADYKHLPVFHQVDGIIVDPAASLVTLIGTLSAFYRKMGFPKVKVVPSFFPYTEPSAEVQLFLESRNDWVEMGGSGVFRPEVTLPVGITDRVLAWGLGLERLAMLTHNLDSIGALYYATMPWLREEPLCRS
jgi:phenylalanyl-tRNA synthetase alpha chain